MWLKINHRLTVPTIFNTFDLNRDGKIEKELFPKIFERLGIQLRDKEVDMLFNCLNKDDPYLAQYRPLVVEVTTGPRQIEFLPKCSVEVAEKVIEGDLLLDVLQDKIDKKNTNKATKNQCLEGLDECIKDLRKEMSDKCFTYYKIRNDLDNMDTKAFVQDVKDATMALVINKVREAVITKGREYARDTRLGATEETKGLNIDTEFSKVDIEHDGIIYSDQFDKVLDAYNIKDVKKNIRTEYKSLLDHAKTGEITLNYFKVIHDLPRSQSQDAHFGIDMKPTKDAFKERENEEIENNARRALKRIYQTNNLLDKLGKQLSIYDNDKDGVMHRNILRQSIQDCTKGVHQDDIDYITQFADKRNKGYFNPEKFLDSIVKIAQDEAKKDAILRRLNNVVKHKGIDLQKELMTHTKNKSGVIDTYDFAQAMRQMRIGLDGNDMDELIRYASSGEKFIDVKHFCKMIEDSSKLKAIVVPVIKKLVDGVRKGDINEKEHKKLLHKIQVLTNNLLDAKRELEQIEKNSNDWKAIAEKNEKALNILSDRLLDPKGVIERLADIDGEGTSVKVLKQQLRQQERILALSSELEELAKKNEHLEKITVVDCKSHIADYENETKNATRKLQSMRSENISLQNQIDKLANAGSTFERNEEADYARQMNMKNLEERIRELISNEIELNSAVLEAEHKNLDMKFERENHNMKMQRLSDKISDLEDYIEIYTQLPSSMIDKVKNDKGFDIVKEMAHKPGPSKRSAAELEKVIDGLKRVINSYKAELDQFKKKSSKFDNSKLYDKISTNKQIKDEIDNLEKELKTIEKKDKEIGELQLRNDKMTDANRALNSDVKNEQKRYEFLESKYKELLVKYNVTFKDLEKKENSLFALTTGANKGTYKEYLEQKENSSKKSPGKSPRKSPSKSPNKR
jgi:Ca2+-binding EF-hand superfamily protein